MPSSRLIWFLIGFYAAIAVVVLCATVTGH